MIPPETPIEKAWRLLRRNAVVILPFLVTVFQATDGLSFKDAVPVIVGLVLRQFFTSPTFEVQEREGVAYREGLLMADVSRAARQARLDAEDGYPAPGEDVPPF